MTRPHLSPIRLTPPLLLLARRAGAALCLVAVSAGLIAQDAPVRRGAEAVARGAAARPVVKPATGGNPAAQAGAYPVVPGKYLTLLRSFADLALREGRDTYGPQHSPVFVDGLSVSPPHTPAPWEIDDRYHEATGYPKRSYICNAVSFTPFSRLLREITSLSGERKYEEAARAAVDYMLQHYTHANGLGFWGSHSAWDCLNDRYTGLAGETNLRNKSKGPPMHEMKNPNLDYRFMHSVNPAVMETYIQQFWSASMAGPADSWTDWITRVTPASCPPSRRYSGGTPG